jgi:hypothetical protein
VGNLAHAAFVGHFFAIPLQSTTGGAAAPDSYTERSLSDALAHLFAYVFLDLDTAQSFKNRLVSARDTERLGKVMQRAVADIKARRGRRGRGHSISQMVFGGGKPAVGDDPVLSSYGPRLVERLLDGLGGVDETVWTIIPTAAAASATQAQGVRSSFPQALSLRFSLTASVIVGSVDRPVPFRPVQPPLA